MSRIHRKHKIFAISFIILAIGLASWMGTIAWKDHQTEVARVEKIELFESVKIELDRYFHEGGERPTRLNLDGKEISLEYGINEELEAHVKKLIRRYSSAHVAVVVMDNDSGNLLVSLGHSKKAGEFGPALPFTATHPAASLFKIVTAADLLENTPITEDSRFKFHGRGTTLYKKQLEKTNSRWARYQSLEKAFAFSNNVIFGKAAINQTTSESLMRMAYDFGFNREIMEEVHLSRSIVEMPENQYNFAELASGFNRDTLISPIHGAAIASIAANGGRFVTPRLLKKVSDVETGEVLWLAKRKEREALRPESAVALRQMMELTVSRGTASRSFRRFDRKIRKLVEVGGKTGSISGGMPDGKRDWFTSFAIPKDEAAGRGISVCIMIVNDNKWYVKSSYLAKEIIEYYYKKILRIENAFIKDGSSQVRKQSEGRS
tara:strand:+ start:3463 stop:4764 length:1302 start_codon:yes stop_codon:yes gene_type:complete